jgi:hypothetical protein
MFDEVDDDSDKEVDMDVRSTLQEVELPFSKGHSAFSIKANTVYILYPSLFQDPNIFGRFAINQNLDSTKEVRTTTDEELDAISPDAMQLQLFDSLRFPQTLSLEDSEKLNQQPYVVKQPYRRSTADFPLALSATNAHQPYLDDEVPSQPNENNGEKRNVETHLSGTIVVLNQDVNEKNTKESY